MKIEDLEMLTETDLRVLARWLKGTEILCCRCRRPYREHRRDHNFVERPEDIPVEERN